MATLHIEHPISDFTVWKQAFDRFSALRGQAGVRSERIQRPLGRLDYVVIDLEFDTTSEAEQFLEILRTRVWGVRENSPALAGEPQTTILEAAGSAS